MIQKIFSLKGGEQLRNDLKRNLLEYKNQEQWVLNLYNAQEIVIDSSFEVDTHVQLAIPNGVDLFDIANSIAFYKAYKNLTVSQASNPLIWAYLCHVQYWEYMRKRWPIENSSDGKESEYIKEHYFLRAIADRALIRNGIARLWWYAHVTYQPTAEDPFELTRILLNKLDIAQGLLERSWGRNRNILHAYLTFLKENPELLVGSEENRKRTRYLYKALTLKGGVSLLDLLSKEDLIIFLKRSYDNYEAKKLIIQEI